jgi:hypothetical protein
MDCTAHFRTSEALEINGRTQTVRDWVRETGVQSPMIFNRLDRGWPPELAVSPPCSQLPRRALKTLLPIPAPPPGSALEFWSRLAGMPPMGGVCPL